MPRCCKPVNRTGDQDARQVIQGALFGFVFKALVSFVGVLKGTLEGAWLVGKSVVYLGSDLSVALLGVGMIVRLNIAALVFLGGGLGWLLTLPILSADISSPENPVERAYAVWSQQVRYIGVGAMVVGGVVTIGQVWSGLGEAIRALLPAARIRTDRGSGPASGYAPNLDQRPDAGLPGADRQRVLSVYRTA